MSGVSVPLVGSRGTWWLIVRSRQRFIEQTKRTGQIAEGMGDFVDESQQMASPGLYPFLLFIEAGNTPKIPSQSLKM
jgi:hypothetical protein